MVSLIQSLNQRLVHHAYIVLSRHIAPLVIFRALNIT